LKLLSPWDTVTYSVSADAREAVISIECDKLLPGQEIQFYGTQELPVSSRDREQVMSPIHNLYPNPVRKGQIVHFSNQIDQDLTCEIYDISGARIWYKAYQNEKISIDTSEFRQGIYLVKVAGGEQLLIKRLIVV